MYNKYLSLNIGSQKVTYLAQVSRQCFTFHIISFHTFSSTFSKKPSVEMPGVTSQTYAARITIYYPVFAW